MIDYQENAFVALQLNRVIPLAFMSNWHASRMPNAINMLLQTCTRSALSSSSFNVQRDSIVGVCLCRFAVNANEKQLFSVFSRMFGAAHIISSLIEIGSKSQHEHPILSGFN